MEENKKKLLAALGFEDQVKNIEAGNCSWCGSDEMKPEDFEDKLSLKQSLISGMCQKCQNETFG